VSGRAVHMDVPPEVFPETVPERLSSEPEAIFVVGVARSGTTLMRNLLERSERIALARENHFLGHIFGFSGVRHYLRSAGNLESDDTIRHIVDMIYTGDARRLARWREVSIYWHWLVANVPRAEMERRLLAAERSERGLMAAFMRVYADKLGRPVMGEKTPAHLAYVDTLLEWFPQARVVHMIRDPRAVYVSDLRRRRRKPRRPYSWLDRIPGLLPALMLLQTTMIWRDAASRHLRYLRRYPERYTLVRFEDVVQAPEEVLPRLFEFLDVALPADPTDVRVYAYGFNAGEHGIDKGAVDRWRGQIGRVGSRFLGLTLGRSMRRLGYTD
jgi:Sulfotransferase family